MTPSRRRSTISSTASEPDAAERRFRAIFRRVHAQHPPCLRDEWLTEPCRTAAGAAVDRPIVWSRRNGAWLRVPVLFVGAAPGNAGGMGRGTRGAHGTRIPFGGDVAGANLDVLLASIGLDRDRTFLCATLNQLPQRGGGEPTLAEIVAPVGSYASSLHLLRDTLLAAGAPLVVALGNVALRATIAAATLAEDAHPSSLRLPSLASLERLGFARGRASPLSPALAGDDAFRHAWRAAWSDAELPSLLRCYHPSAQNMSPFAGTATVFHRRMIETRDALHAAFADAAERGRLPAPVPRRGRSVYDLPEWRSLIEPYHARLVTLWRSKGLG